MSEPVAHLVRRLQRRMVWLAVAVGIPYGFLGSGRGLVVLTLSVAAAIVHLRWLASHVVSLSAPALSANEPGPATEPGSARHETRIDATVTSPPANEPTHDSVQNATQPDPASDRGASSRAAQSRVGPESEDYAPRSLSGLSDSAPQNDRQSPIEVSSPSEGSGAETASFSTKASAVAALMRLPLLFAIVGGLVFIGRSHPLALGLGLGTLPIAMVLEAWNDQDSPIA